MFINRQDAGEKLSVALSDYRNKNVLVLGIPRGGAEIAYYIARYLNADLALIVTRKLGWPSNPEAAFGAIAEDGSVYLSDEANRISTAEIEKVVQQETKEIKRRVKRLRKGQPLPEMKDRTVILADDGIATGSTLFVAISLCKKKKAGKIIVAVPISGAGMDATLEKMVDKVIILEKPEFFYAVGQGYRDFDDVTDEETIRFIDKWQYERLTKTPT